MKNNDKEQTKNELLDHSLRYYLFRDGIEITYNSFRKDENDTSFLISLLNLNFNYLNDARDNMNILIKSIDCKFNRIRLIDAIKMSYDNIASILQSNKEFNFADYILEGTNVYALTRIFSALHDLTAHFEIKEIESTGFATIMRAISWDDNKHKLQKFLIPLIISTLKNGETWCLELIRDWDFFYIFDKNILNFITFYAYYLVKLDKASTQQVKDSINRFLSSQSHGLNSDGSSWKDVFKQGVRYNGSRSIIDNIDNFFDIFNLFPSNLYRTFVKQFGFSVSYSNDNFLMSIIAHIWLEFLLFSRDLFELDNEGVKSLFNKIKHKDELISFIQKDVFDEDFKPQFLLWLYDDDSFVYYNEQRLNSLKECLTNINIEKINSLGSEISRDLLVDVKNNILRYVNQKTHLILNKNIKLKEQGFYTILLDKGFFADKNSINKLCNFAYDDIISNLLKKTINSCKRDVVTSSHTKNNIELNSDLIKKSELIYKNCPITPLFIDSDARKIISSLQIINAYFKNLFFYWRQNAISFNINFSERSGFKYLTLEDAYRMINNEYECINGLYRYEQNGLIVLLTHEELAKKIIDKYSFFVFIYDYNIICNPKEIICLSNDTTAQSPN